MDPPVRTAVCRLPSVDSLPRHGLQHDRRLTRFPRRLDAQPPGHPLRGVLEGICRCRFRMRGHDWRTLVSAGTNDRFDRDLAEQLDSVLFGDPLAAAATEDVVDLFAIRADEPAHVLDD